MKQSLLVAALVLLIVGCTAQVQQVSELPTLALLPSITPDFLVPTRLPTLTPTPGPTAMPTAVPTSPCDTDAAAWWRSTETVFTEFMDTLDVAQSTPRVSLGVILLELQRQYRDFERLEYPPCAETIRNQTVAAMGRTIEGFNDFLADLEFSADRELELAQIYWWALGQELQKVDSEVDLRIYGVFLSQNRANAMTATWISTNGDEAFFEVKRAELDATLDYYLATDTLTPSRTPTNRAGPASRATPSSASGYVGSWIILPASPTADGSMIYGVRLSSVNLVSGATSTGSVEMLVYCGIQVGFGVTISANGLGFERRNSMAMTDTRIRLDDQPSSLRILELSDDGNFASFQTPISVIRPFRFAERLQLEFTPLGGAPQIAEFDLTGMSEAMRQSSAECFAPVL